MTAGQLLASGGFGHIVPAPGGVCVSTGLFLGWEIFFFVVVDISLASLIQSLRLRFRVETLHKLEMSAEQHVKWGQSCWLQGLGVQQKSSQESGDFPHWGTSLPL